MAEDDRVGADEHAEERPRTGLRRRLGRLLNQRELAEDTREVLGGMLEMSDRAKTEAVRLVAREARNYLDELKIKEDLLELITSHSLEVQLSVHLKPLADAVQKGEASERSSGRRDPDEHQADDDEAPGRWGGRRKARQKAKATRDKDRDKDTPRHDHDHDEAEADRPRRKAAEPRANQDPDPDEQEPPTASHPAEHDDEPTPAQGGDGSEPDEPQDEDHP